MILLIYICCPLRSGPRCIRPWTYSPGKNARLKDGLSRGGRIRDRGLLRTSGGGCPTSKRNDHLAVCETSTTYSILESTAIKQRHERNSIVGQEGITIILRSYIENTCIVRGALSILNGINKSPTAYVRFICEKLQNQKQILKDFHKKKHVIRLISMRQYWKLKNVLSRIFCSAVLSRTVICTKLFGLICITFLNVREGQFILTIWKSLAPNPPHLVNLYRDYA